MIVAAIVIVIILLIAGLIFGVAKDKSEDLSRIGQYLQGAAAILAVLLAVSSGGEISNKIESLANSVSSMEKVLNRIDENVSKITVPKSIFDEKPNQTDDQKRNTWSEAIERIQNTSLNQIIVQDKAGTVESLLKARDEKQAQEILGRALLYQDTINNRRKVPAEVTVFPANGSLEFYIKKEK